MKRFAFPAALLVVACMLLGPLLEWAPTLRAERSVHEVLCGDHDCGCDGRAPVSTATCCCAGALLPEVGPPPPPPGVDPARWQLAWGDAPVCRPATLHDLPESRWANSPCGVDLEPEGQQRAAAPRGLLPEPLWLPRPTSRPRRDLEARVAVVRRPVPLAKVPIQRG